MLLKSLFSVLLLLFVTNCFYGQSAHKLLRQGDNFFLNENLPNAEESYRKSQEQDGSLKASYNLGNSVYNQNRFEEAAEQFQKALQFAENDEEKSKAYYNLGNAFYKNQQLEQSIEAYKNAIQLNPDDPDARKNLFLAKMIQQQQQQQQENQEDQQENQDEQNQDQQQNQEGQQSQNPIENEPTENQPQEAQKLSREDAMKLLQVIENEEKKVQEKLRKTTGKRKKPEKDW